MTLRGWPCFLAKWLGEASFNFLLNIQKHSHREIMHAHTYTQNPKALQEIQLSIYYLIQFSRTLWVQRVGWCDMIQAYGYKEMLKQMEISSLFMFSSTQCTASLSFYQDPLALLMKCEQIDSPKPELKRAFTLWCPWTACETFQLMLRWPLGIPGEVQETFFFLSFPLSLPSYFIYIRRNKSHRGKYKLVINAKAKNKTKNFQNFSKPCH